MPTFSRTLLIFARAPIAGRCKTRLMPRYGGRGAAVIHRRLVTSTLRTAAATKVDAELWCEPHTGHGFFHACRRDYDLVLRRQCSGDLGRKMAVAVQKIQSRSRAVVIVGTDCATLDADDIEQAFLALEKGADCVIKPAEDGGYVLIGARCPLGLALRKIDWSSGRELGQTLSRLRRRGLAVDLLETTWDVDHPKDVVRARQKGLL